MFVCRFETAADSEWFGEDNQAVSGVVRAIARARDPWAHKRQEAEEILRQVEIGEPIELAGFPAAARIKSRPQNGEMKFLKSTTKIPDWRSSMNFEVLADAMDKVSAKAGKHTSNFVNALNDGYRDFARIARKVHEAKVSEREKTRLCEGYRQIVLSWFRAARAAEEQQREVPPLDLSGFWDPSRWEKVDFARSSGEKTKHDNKASFRSGVGSSFGGSRRDRPIPTDWWPYNRNEAFPWLSGKKIPRGACKFRFLNRDGCKFGSNCRAGSHDAEQVKKAVEAGLLVLTP